MNDSAQVSVVYASVDQQYIVSIPFVQGMTALDAVIQSGIQQQVELPENLQLGIFGAYLKDHAQLLSVGDRVEIYRELTINPKDIRRKRAAKNPVGRYLKSNRLRRLNEID